MNEADPSVETSPVWRSFRVIAIIGGLALVLILIGRTCFDTQGRVLVKARTPNGVEVYVVQRCDVGPFYCNTSFYCRRPDGVWGWGYIDHEDGFWRASRAAIQFNTNEHRVVVLRDGKPLLHYDWQRDEYVLGSRDDVSTGTDLWDPTRPAPSWWSADLFPAK